MVHSLHHTSIILYYHYFCSLTIQQILIGLCHNNYVGILARLNLSVLYFRQMHLNCDPILDSVNVHIPTRIIRDFSTLYLHHHFNAIPSDNCTYAV
jgi:hypothetical protein